MTIRQGISEEGKILADFLDAIGTWRAVVTRHNGDVEVKQLNNIVTKDGLNALASRAIADTTSPAGWTAIGTLSAAGSLGSVVGSLGEVGRKAGITVASSKEVFYMVTTWGGAADGITSVSLQSASMVNHVNSGSGIGFNCVNGINTTLADSDFLLLEAQIRVGSHNL